MKKVLVIGGGPAGMMAAGVAAQNGHEVQLFEKNSKLGKKLAITGKGRCNITNAGEIEELIGNINGNPKFLYSAFYTFTNDDVIHFFNQMGVETKVERGNRIFPVSDRALDVVYALEQFMINNHVHIHRNCEVQDIIIENHKMKGVKLNDQKIVEGDVVVVATGGLSYPTTGSTGKGYEFGKRLGHTIIDCKPSLVPMIIKEQWIKELQGLSLKNVSIEIKDQDNQSIYKEFGEMLFTHYGVTGPIILSTSRVLCRHQDTVLHLYLDLKPALDEKMLDKRILRDFEKYHMKDFKNALDDLLPKKLIPTIIKLSKIPEDKKVHQITKEERLELIHLLKALKCTIVGTRGFKEAIVTAGGVNVDEINPHTMESVLIPDLYFVGEVLDVDGYTGGYNLQIAFSTGYLAGININ